MKYRKWDPKTKAKIVLEGLQNNQPLSELCNNYQITQNQYYNWLKEFQSKSHKAFDSSKKSRREQRVVDENKKLKRIIAELTIELKKQNSNYAKEKIYEKTTGRPDNPCPYRDN